MRARVVRRGRGGGGRVETGHVCHQRIAIEGRDHHPQVGHRRPPHRLEDACPQRPGRDIRSRLGAPLQERRHALARALQSFRALRLDGVEELPPKGRGVDVRAAQLQRGVEALGGEGREGRRGPVVCDAS